MLYRTKKTGAIINVNAEMRGNWEPVKAPAAPAEAEKKPAPARRKGTVKK